MFFQRKKEKDKDKAKTKKKWEEELLEDAMDKSAMPSSISCEECKEELVGSGVYCLACNVYFCCPHFKTSHGPEETRLLQETTQAFMQKFRERWELEDQNAARERESAFANAVAQQALLDRIAVESLHPASRGESVKRSEIETFKSALRHPAAIQNMDHVRAATRAKRERELSIKHWELEGEHEAAVRKEEREAQERGLVKEAMEQLQQQGHIHKFRPLVGEQGTDVSSPECLRLRVGWMVSMPQCQMIRKRDVPLGQSDEEGEEEEGETTEDNKPSNTPKVAATSPSIAPTAVAANGEKEEAKEPTKRADQLLVRKILATFSHEVTSEELEDFFGACGEIKDLHLRHKGEAIIKFATATGVQQALTLNMKKLRGRSVFINIYDPEGVARSEDKEPAGTKFRLCMNFKRGTCFKGDCPDAHHPRELTPAVQQRELARRQRQEDRRASRERERAGSRERRSRERDRERRDSRDRRGSRDRERRSRDGRRSKSRGRASKERKRSRSTKRRRS